MVGKTFEYTQNYGWWPLERQWEEAPRTSRLRVKLTPGRRTNVSAHGSANTVWQLGRSGMQDATFLKT